MSDERPKETVTASRVQSLHRKRLSLQAVQGADAGKRFDFHDRARVGSRALADLVLDDPKVSGLHCEVLGGENLRVRDLGSKNGTWLGGQRIIEAFVRTGDLIRVGDTSLRVMPTEELIEVPLLPGNHFHGIIGESPAMRALTAQIERLAQAAATVLIQGESGTGKECVAAALHAAGPRVDQPLVIVDCGALPATLIESELFGHERGAFTGALTGVAGAFERAHGGTLFLDEIGELALELQPKLLRALQSRRVRRLGGQREIEVDVRLVAATNRDLALEVTAGRFREDLYYRLAVVVLRVPPLREHREDIRPLAIHFVRELGGDPTAYLTSEVLEGLAEHDWPGNVRELRNTVERALALMEPISVAADDQSVEVGADPLRVDLSLPLRAAKRQVSEALERAYLTQMLKLCNGNISEAARRAQIDRMSVYRILQRLKIQ